MPIGTTPSTNDTQPPVDLDHLRSYYRAFGPALKIAVVERALSLPERTLRHWLRGEQGLATWHIPKLLAWAIQVGYDPSRQYDAFL